MALSRKLRAESKESALVLVILPVILVFLLFFSSFNFSLFLSLLYLPPPTFRPPLYACMHAYIHTYTKGYALCRRPLEVHVCVKLSAPTDAVAGVQSFFVACLFVHYHGNKPSKMYLIKGRLEVKLRTRGTYGKAEVVRVREE